MADLLATVPEDDADRPALEAAIDALEGAMGQPVMLNQRIGQRLAAMGVVRAADDVQLQPRLGEWAYRLIPGDPRNERY